MIKVYAENFNGVLDGTIALLESRGMLTDKYHKADAFLLWNDVRGPYLEIARIAKSLGKPVFVMQHGRGATRDYCPPSNFPLLADKIFVWGDVERLRLLKVGVPEGKISVVGCPLFKRLRPRQKRNGVNVIFAPVISSKEEPENILVYSELKKWECEKLSESIYEKMGKLKESWNCENKYMKTHVLPDGTSEDRLWRSEIVNRVPRNIIYQKGLLNVLVTSLHDEFQYMSPVIKTSQGSKDHINIIAELLQNTDAIVCLEEGTLPLLACALDIPVVVADVFSYKEYGGVKDYDRIEKIATNAVYRTDRYFKIPRLLDLALSRPDELRRKRIETCEKEGGAHLDDPDASIVREIEQYCAETVTA